MRLPILEDLGFEFITIINYLLIKPLGNAPKPCGGGREKAKPWFVRISKFLLFYLYLN
jgi:hypothetical protein